MKVRIRIMPVAYTGGFQKLGSHSCSDFGSWQSTEPIELLSRVYGGRQDLRGVRQCKFYLDSNSDNKIKITKSIVSSSFTEDQ